MKILKKHERLKIEQGKHLSASEHIESADYPLHWHSYFEIEIILSGKGKYLINDIEYDVAQYNVFFLTPTDFHDVRVEEEIRLINVSFEEDTIDEQDIGSLMFSQNEKAYRLDSVEYERMASAARLLVHECSIEGDCQRQLLKYVLKCVLRKNATSAEGVVSGENRRGIKRAIVYMQMHFKEDISLRMIAAEAGYHPTYFSELFKQVTGESYIDTLTKLRIGYARSLLANGFSVSDTCFLSGFGSLSNFLTVFKKHCHVCPSQYRAKYADLI